MFDNDTEILTGLFIVGFPVVFGYLIPTIADYFIKRYEENHKCKHLHTVWCDEPPSKFLCISRDRKICVCKDCGEIVGDIFFEHEGMGYK